MVKGIADAEGNLLARTLKLSGLVAVLSIAALVILMAYSQPLFAFSVAAGRIEFWSDRPIEATAAGAIAKDIQQRLEQGPLRLDNGPYRIFVANEAWRRRLIWNVVASPLAGGIAFYPVSGRNVFLSGADFQRGELIAGDGTLIGPPRTLAYYGAHEITHVLTGERLGTIRYHSLPVWIREGLADYVGMAPRQPFAALHKAVADRPNHLELWQAHGFYTHFRLLVQYFIEVEGWTIEQLLDSTLSLDEATQRMRAAVAARPALVR